MNTLTKTLEYKVRFVCLATHKSGRYGIACQDDKGAIREVKWTSNGALVSPLVVDDWTPSPKFGGFYVT